MLLRCVALSTLVTCAACGGSTTAAGDAGNGNDAGPAGTDAAAQDQGPSDDAGVPPDTGAEGAPSGDVELTSDATWVAVRVGTDAWQQLQPTTVGGRVYTFTAGASDPYAIAEARLDTNGQHLVRLSLATRDEVARWLGLHVYSTYSVTGSVTGLGSGDAADVSMHGDYQLYVTPQSPAFTLDPVVAGPQDLVGLRYVSGAAPTAIAIQRGIDVTRDLTGLTLDFGTGTLPLTSQALTATGGYAFAQFFSSRGTGVALGDTTTGHLTYTPLLTGTGEADTYHLWGTASTSDRAIVRTFDASTENPGDQSFDLSAVATLNDALLHANWPPHLASLTYVPAATSPELRSWEFTIYQLGRNLLWTGVVSAGWLGGAATAELPDLTAAPGFDAANGLAPNVQSQFQLSAVMLSTPLQPIEDADQLQTVPGIEMHLATRQGYSYLTQ